MTVPVQTPYIGYSGNGVTTLFAFGFRVDAEADLYVLVDGVVKILGVDYGVAAFGPSGGSIVFNSPPPAPTVVTPNVVLARYLAREQDMAYPPFGPFPSASHERALDELTMMIQDLQVQLSFVFGTDPTLPLLPPSGAQEVNALWNFTVNPTVNGNLIWHEGNLTPAVAATQLLTTDAGIINILNPTFADDITLDIKSNVAGGTVKLDAQAKIPPALLSFTGMVFRGVFNNVGGDNPSEEFPGNVYAAGEFYVIGTDDLSTITVKNAVTGADYEQLVDPQDTLVYNTIAAGAPATGWYWVSSVAAVAAINVAFTPVGHLAATNVQAAIAELDAEVAFLADAETVGGLWTFAAGLAASNGSVVSGATALAAVANFDLQTAAGFARALRVKTGANLRWSFGANATAEGGANAGSNLELLSYNDAGALLKTLLFVVRSTGAGVWDAPFTFAPGTLTVGGPAVNFTSLNFDSTTSGSKHLIFNSNALGRWVLSVVNNESGGNVGSDFRLQRYDDAGTLIDTPLIIPRSTGVIDFLKQFTIGSKYQPITKFHTSDQSVANTTLVAITGLAEDVVNGATYFIEADLVFSQVTGASGIKLRVGGVTVTAAGSGVTLACPSGAAVNMLHTSAEIGSDLVISSVPGGSDDIALRISGTVKPTADGTLTVSFADNSGVSSLTIRAGSRLTTQRMS